jgi:hypothetical protein
MRAHSLPSGSLLSESTLTSTSDEKAYHCGRKPRRIISEQPGRPDFSPPMQMQMLAADRSEDSEHPVRTLQMLPAPDSDLDRTGQDMHDLPARGRGRDQTGVYATPGSPGRHARHVALLRALLSWAPATADKAQAPQPPSELTAAAGFGLFAEAVGSGCFASAAPPDSPALTKTGRRARRSDDRDCGEPRHWQAQPNSCCSTESLIALLSAPHPPTQMDLDRSATAAMHGFPEEHGSGGQGSGHDWSWETGWGSEPGC